MEFVEGGLANNSLEGLYFVGMQEVRWEGGGSEHVE
jgi:hypothetical protein